jgi:hypothetical protein
VGMESSLLPLLPPPCSSFSSQISITDSACLCATTTLVY